MKISVQDMKCMTLTEMQDLIDTIDSDCLYKFIYSRKNCKNNDMIAKLHLAQEEREARKMPGKNTPWAIQFKHEWELNTERLRLVE